MAGNPRHGQPGHECPGDIIVEWRPRAIELVDYQRGLETVMRQVISSHLMAQMTGDQAAVDELTQVHGELKESWEKIEGWRLEFIKAHAADMAEEMKWQEFNVDPT